MAAFLYRWLLGAFSGALLVFGAVIAPAMFRVLPPHDAGAVVRQVVPMLDAIALAIAVVAIAIGAALEGLPTGKGRWRVAALALVAAAAGVSSGWVTPRMERLRNLAGGGVSELRPDDPVRREFGQLHGVSSGLMLLQWAFATAALASVPRRKDRPA